METSPSAENTPTLLAAARSRIVDVGVVALGVVVGWTVWVCDLHTDWEDRMYFHLMEMRAVPPTRETGVVQIKVEDMTDEPWPWPHLDYAILLHALAPFQPEVLALDLPLEFSDPLYPVYERQLARQMRAFRDVVLSAKPSLELRPTPAPPGLEPLPSDGFTQKLARIGSVRWPIEPYWSNTRISPTAAAGSKEGRVALVYRMADAVVPAFPLVIYGKSIGAYWPHCELLSGDAILLRDYQKKLLARIPVDAQGRLRLLPEKQLPPPVGVEFYTAVLSAEQMLKEARPLFDLNRLRRQIVLVSLAHPDTASSVPSPEGSAYPGSITARVLQQLLLRKFQIPAPAPMVFLLLLICALLATWAGSLRKGIHGLGTLVGGLLFLGFDAWFALSFFNLTLPLGALGTTILASWSLAYAWVEINHPETAPTDPIQPPAK